MKKAKIIYCIVISLLLIGGGVLFYLQIMHPKNDTSNNASKQEKSITPKKKLGREGKVKFITLKSGQDVTEAKQIYNQDFQDACEKEIGKLISKHAYTTDEPLLIVDPCKTNTGSVYYYAKLEQACYAKCKILPEKGDVIEQRLMNSGSNGLDIKQEYLITGLAPGQKNVVELSFYDETDELIDRVTYNFVLQVDAVAPEIVNVEKGDSKVELSDGLFAILGHDKNIAVNTYYYDNQGVFRGRTPLEKYRTDRILTIDGKLVYSYNLSKIAVVNRLGKIEEMLDLGKYELHHDFMYDESRGQLLCLVNNTDKDTIEDVLIAVDMKTGKVNELVDYEVLLQDMRNASKQRKGGKNTYGGTELDWLHLNSLDLIQDGELIVSSREESVLIKVSNIYGEPKLDYLIHTGTLYKGTQYEKLLLKQVGDFVGCAGQHTITVEHDDTLQEGQYYLYLYDNHFGSAKTLPQFDWSEYPGVGSYTKGEASYYTKYLVDENTRTFSQVQEFAVPYSSVVSGVNQYHGNITFSSGMDHTYGEYDENGNMICTYTYAADKYAYRVIKYDFEGLYYEAQ